MAVEPPSATPVTKSSLSDGSLGANNPIKKKIDKLIASKLHNDTVSSSRYILIRYEF